MVKPKNPERISYTPTETPEGVITLRSPEDVDTLPPSYIADLAEYLYSIGMENLRVGGITEVMAARKARISLEPCGSKDNSPAEHDGEASLRAQIWEALIGRVKANYSPR